MTCDLRARCRRVLAASIRPWMRVLLLATCAALAAVWWRVADRDNRAGEIRPPKLHRSRRARRIHILGELRNAWIV